METNYWDTSDQMFRYAKQVDDKNKVLFKEITEALDKLFNLQEITETHKENPELVSEIIAERFVNQYGVSGAEVVDYEVILKLRELEAFAEDIHELLNHHDLLISPTEKLEDKEIKAIVEYIKFKKQNVNL